ncbi:hypothetical protein FHS08_001193 [Microbacterium ulmi]|nr:hypothetical protein [Microbacterium ulmi]
MSVLVQTLPPSSGCAARATVATAITLVALAFVPGIERQGVDLAGLSDRPMDAGGVILIAAAWGRSCAEGTSPQIASASAP